METLINVCSTIVLAGLVYVGISFSLAVLHMQGPVALAGLLGVVLVGGLGYGVLRIIWRDA